MQNAQQVTTLSFTSRRFDLVLDDERAGIFRRFAEALFDGNATAAFRGLIDLHAGRALELAEEAEEPVAVETVVQWKKPRLSREVASYVAGLIRAGVLEADAYRLAGVTPKQWSRWMREGRKDRDDGKESLAADLVHAVERAQAELKLQRVRKIESSSDWRAQMTLLARQFPGEYAERKRVDSNVQHTVMPMVDFDKLTLEEARTWIRLTRKMSPDAGEPGIGARARPAAELLPGEVLELVEDADFTELPARAPADLAAGGEAEAPVLEAPALEAGRAPAAGSGQKHRS